MQAFLYLIKKYTGYVAQFDSLAHEKLLTHSDQALDMQIIFEFHEKALECFASSGELVDSLSSMGFDQEKIEDLFNQALSCCENTLALNR